MSIQLGHLCSVILEQHFGENVRIVGQDLFSAIAKSLSMIMKSTKLTRNEVTQALAILLKFRLIKFTLAPNGTFAEYSIQSERILLILRYPKYVYFIQSKYGHAAALLTEELLRTGCQTASYIIVKSVANGDSKDKSALIEYRDKFMELVQANYFVRAPVPVKDQQENTSKNVPILDVDASSLFLPPTVNLTELMALQEDKKITTQDTDIYWLVNFVRFHQDFRDAILISAIERQIDLNAGENLKYILQLMYTRTDAWQAVSNPIPFVEIKNLCEKKSNNLELLRYLDQYISAIIDDPLNILIKSGNIGGGQYVVQMKIAFEQLTWACIENIITEKFGSKAARIFRVVRLKKYIEQEDIQKEAMVPSKEAKQLTYKLLEEHFLQIQTIKKAGGGGSGPAKSFYLFYVNQTQAVSMLLEICYKALFNAITRSSYDSTVNRRLIDKSQRLYSIVEAMKERGESEEYISEILETLTPPEKEILEKVKIRIKNLYSAEIGLDDTIFLFQLYQYYKTVK